MRLLRIIAVLLVLTGSTAFAVDNQLMLQAILLKENSCGRVGKRGETGPWQMMPANVAKYGGHDYIHAYSMLLDVEKDMREHRVWLSAYNIALYWNAGPKAMRNQAPIISYRYAIEVQQIYNQLQSSRLDHPAKF